MPMMPMMPMIPILPMALLAAAAPSPQTPPAIQSTAAIDAAVARFTGHRLGEPGGARAAVDPRLRLAACAAPAIEWRSAARDAVVVRCPDPQWRLFVAITAPPPAPAAAAAPTPTPIPATAPAPAARPAPAPIVVRRGDAVLVEAGAEGFAVSREGVAMNDAAAGARLTVRIDETRPPIQAIAVAAGRARLPGWGD